ncbi:hypothetical protein C7H09_00495 [Marinobacter fuscus]|uniref:Uncharacterized protein n=1 Tax=Marinobacter fuscus TaxID=2109942 RepID=A0A2T1KWA5_9GAMM|nr:hypothetical protein [Marinobacter fuscus]PSF14367.1 hypothetical protein C7H09_00495 [Marinobacter fuscus]
MSLLTSLIQASTRFQQAMEQPASRTDKAESNAPEAQPLPQSEGDDRFTPSQRDENAASLKTRKLPLSQYKQTVAQDLSYVRETLRHKLAEYNLHPATAINVSRNDDGSLQLNGKMPEPIREKMQQDLAQNKNFSEALGRLSINEPTLHFMDNALKLSSAYGVQNSLLDSLVSENQQFNGLNDLIHRYDSLRRTAEPTQTISARQPYAFSLNARA